MNRNNIFLNIPCTIPDEIFEEIIHTDSCTIERIISKGHSSPQDYWYDQEKNEWVMLLKGSACIVFGDTNEQIIMKPGDYITIPAHRKHRVEWTDPDEETIWLAIHYL
ncbi:MAG: cupin domain-containing protein [bacterium]